MDFGAGSERISYLSSRTGFCQRPFSSGKFWQSGARGSITFFLALFLMAAVLSGCSGKAEEKAFFRAERAHGEGVHMEAIAFYRIFVEDFSDSDKAPEAQYRIGVIYDRYLKDGVKAMEAYSMLLYLFPGTPQAMLAREERAKIYSLKGRHRDAIAEYAWMLEYGTEERGGLYRYNIALEYIKMADYGQARIELDELIKSASSTEPSGTDPVLISDAYYQIAASLQLEGDYNGAVKAYDEFIDKSPGHALYEDALLHKATVLEQSGKLKEAIALMVGLKAEYPQLSEALDIKIASAKKRLNDGPKLTTRKKRRRRRR